MDIPYGSDWHALLSEGIAVEIKFPSAYQGLGCHNEMIDHQLYPILSESLSNCLQQVFVNGGLMQAGYSSTNATGRVDAVVSDPSCQEPQDVHGYTFAVDKSCLSSCAPAVLPYPV